MTNQFLTWKYSDKDGDVDPYSGTQGAEDIKGDTNSLQTSENTWVIVFNQSKYEGDSMQIGPNTTLKDLNETKRYDSTGKEKGDWKNQIKSFVLYSAKPSYWGSIPTHEQLFAFIVDGQASFTEDTNFWGHNRTFTGPFTALNLDSLYFANKGGPMGNKINSLRTGQSTWLSIFNDIHCDGDFAKIEPNTKLADLNNFTRKDANNVSQGDWKNQISSLLLYKEKPAFWNTQYPRPYIDFKVLSTLFPNKIGDSNSKITYKVGDSTYYIDNPSLQAQTATQIPDDYYINDNMAELPANGWTKYHVSLSHDTTGGRNDDAGFDMFFDNSGKLVNIQHFKWSSKGAFEIPEEFIKIVDAEAWLLGTIGALETLGISELAAEEFIETFDMVCAVFNKVSSLVYNKTDNGGVFYFLPVICHTINRICTTVLKNYHTTIYINPQDSRANLNWSFNYDGFYDAINTKLSPNGNVVSNWTFKDDSTNQSFSQVIEYNYQGFHFRTWYQEISFSTELGMIVSCKIDYEIDSHKDDHIILLMGFSIPAANSRTPILSFARATIQFTDKSSENIDIPVCKGDNSINDVYNQLSSGVAKVSTDSSTQGRKYLADIAKANMNAIMTCVMFS